MNKYITEPLNNNEVGTFLNDPLQDAIYIVRYEDDEEEYSSETELFDRIDEIIDDENFDINQRIEVESGCTLLFIAMFFKNVDLVRRLLDKGADTTILPEEKGGDYWGEDHYPYMTPLHAAVNSGNVEILKLIIAKGGEKYINDAVVMGPLFITNDKYVYPRITPLQIACYTGNVNAVHILLRLGADKNTSINADEYGDLNMYHLALMSTNDDVIKYIDPSMATLMEVFTNETPLILFKNAEIWGLVCSSELWFNEKKEEAVQYWEEKNE